MKREEISQFKINRVIQEEGKYSFPEFLKLLRRMYGMQRKYVSEDTGIAETRLFYLENGRFKRRLGTDELVILADYYGIDCELLKNKVDSFLKSGLARPQHQKTANA